MTTDDRHDQMFPTLTPGEIDRLRRFGEVRHYRAGDALFETGHASPGMFVLLSGTAEMTRRDGFKHAVRIAEQDAGEFVAEVGQLSDRPALVDARALTDLDALLISPAQLRT
ncbi:MAG: Crp/Fnr family transcriptional regulator [Steroidobacteraceae bacterium]